MKKTHHDTILVLDFGAQYSQLIARRVREQQVYSQIVPYTITAEEVKKFAPKGLIFSGGPSSVSKEGSPRPDPKLFDLGIPILGICYGLQVLAVMNGGAVERPQQKEYGFAHLSVLNTESPLLNGIDQKSQVWMHLYQKISYEQQLQRIVPTQQSRNQIRTGTGYSFILR